MKYYPRLSELPTTREMVDVFRGYNHNLRIGDGRPQIADKVIEDRDGLRRGNSPVIDVSRDHDGVRLLFGSRRRDPAKDKGLIGQKVVVYQLQPDMKI